MKKLLLALAFSLFASSAWAQCSGVFPANTFCGNGTASPNVPTPIPFQGGLVSSVTNTDGSLVFSPTTGNVVGSLAKTLPNGVNTQPFTTNAGTVQVGPYATLTTGSANFGPSGGQTSLEFITVVNPWRMRQSGTLTQVQFYLPATTGINGFFIKVWRQQGANFDLVGTSADISGSIAVGTNTLAVSIPNVKIGDFIGARITYTSASVQNFFAQAQTSPNATIYSVLNTTPSTSQFNWTGQTATANVGLFIEGYMSPPWAVAMGDSITSGYPLGTAFTGQNLSTGDPRFSYPYTLSQQLGVQIQDMGWIAQTTTNMLARFTTDVVNELPKYVFINGGINDLILAIPQATTISNMSSMISAAQAAGIIPVVIGITGIRNGAGITNAMMQSRDIINANYKTLVQAAGGIYISPDPVDVYFSGGDPNNLWANGYASADNIHFTTAGYIRLGQVVFNALQGYDLFNVFTPGGLDAQPPFFINYNGTPVLYTTAGTLGVSTYVGPNAGNAGNATGSFNIALGAGTLSNATSADSEIAIGTNALNAETSGNQSVAIGTNALHSSNGGSGNIGIGYTAGSALTSGAGDTIVGAAAAGVLTTANFNSVFGANALGANVSGSFNTGMGYSVLLAATGGSNTAMGYFALADVTSGTFNLGLGYNTGRGITTGGSNTILGSQVTGLAAGLSNAIILADGAGNIRDDYGVNASNVWSLQGGARTIPVLVANLPTCDTAHDGTRASVTDQNTAVAYRGAVTGGGSTHQAVYCNGTAWLQD